MSIENIVRFAEAVSADPKLAEKVGVLRQEPSAPEKIAALAAELGFSMTAEDILAYQASSPELSDEALESVAGGFFGSGTPLLFGTLNDAKGHSCKRSGNGGVRQISD